MVYLLVAPHQFATQDPLGSPTADLHKPDVANLVCNNSNQTRHPVDLPLTCRTEDSHKLLFNSSLDRCRMAVAWPHQQ